METPLNYQQIWAIANATGLDATLSSPNGMDGCAVPAGVVTHTGGSGGNYIRVPTGYPGEPNSTIQIESSDWTVLVWTDYEGGLYWTAEAGASSGTPVPGCFETTNWSMQIQLANGSVTVGWNSF